MSLSCHRQQENAFRSSTWRSGRPATCALTQCQAPPRHSPVPTACSRARRPARPPALVAPRYRPATTLRGGAWRPGGAQRGRTQAAARSAPVATARPCCRCCTQACFHMRATARPRASSRPRSGGSHRRLLQEGGGAATRAAAQRSCLRQTHAQGPSDQYSAHWPDTPHTCSVSKRDTGAWGHVQVRTCVDVRAKVTQCSYAPSRARSSAVRRVARPRWQSPPGLCVVKFSCTNSGASALILRLNGDTQCRSGQRCGADDTLRSSTSPLRYRKCCIGQSTSSVQSRDCPVITRDETQPGESARCSVCAKPHCELPTGPRVGRAPRADAESPRARCGS
eukprot:536841-Rhodomonas_salina.2